MTYTPEMDARRPWSVWITPEFLVFLLAAVLAAGLFLWQTEAGKKTQAMTEAFRSLGSRWAALVETPDPTAPADPSWEAARAASRRALGALTPLEPRVVQVIADLDALPLKVGSLAEYGVHRSGFDRGLEVLEAIRLRQAGGFLGGLSFTLLLGTAAFGLSMRRSVLRASAEARQIRQAERRVRIQEHERWRIARELHDGVAQDLARARLNLAELDCRGCPQAENQAARDDLEGALDLSLREVRWICGTLRRPSESLATLDLVVERCVRDFQAHYGLPVSLERITTTGENWEAGQLHEIARMVLEGLTNIAKHAGARSAVVRTLAVGPQVKVLVEDDGRGIRGPEGFGMRGIRERAALLGGRVQWDTIEAGGTRMTLTIPLPGEQP